MKERQQKVCVHGAKEPKNDKNQKGSYKSSFTDVGISTTQNQFQLYCLKS